MTHHRPFTALLGLSLAALGCTSEGTEPTEDPSVCADPNTAGCVVASDKQRIVNPAVASGDLKALATGNTAFALGLYQHLRAEPGNLFYSPYSVSSALAMISAGARGETANEMATALRFTLPQERLHPAFNGLDQALASRGQGAEGRDGKGFRLNVANSVWGQTGYSFEAPFLDTLAENYGAGLRLADFVGAPDASRGLVNQWVEKSTEGRIKDILPQGSVDPSTRLVLANAIYFNAAWQTPFDKARTASANFTRADGSTVSVPTMAGSVHLAYGEGAGYAALEMPYERGELSMVLVLPADLAAFEAGLDGARLDAVVSSLRGHQVNVHLPKFEFDSSYDLVKPLSDMGMPSAFAGQADFSGITTKDNLAISAVLHKAFVAVDEAGTEAAAATAVVAGTTSVPEPAEIHFDHPFLFFIRDIQTNAVLFVGRVSDPS